MNIFKIDDGKSVGGLFCCCHCCCRLAHQQIDNWKGHWPGIGLLQELTLRRQWKNPQHFCAKLRQIAEDEAGAAAQWPKHQESSQ